MYHTVYMSAVKNKRFSKWILLQETIHFETVVKLKKLGIYSYRKAIYSSAAKRQYAPIQSDKNYLYKQLQVKDKHVRMLIDVESIPAINTWCVYS